jgi:hypothetical protein
MRSKNLAGTLTCKQYHLQAEEGGGGQAMKNLSPQKRAERRHGAERELGSKFLSRPTTCPEDSIPHNSIMTGPERTEACGMKDHK